MVNYQKTKNVRSLSQLQAFFHTREFVLCRCVIPGGSEYFEWKDNNFIDGYASKKIIFYGETVL